MKYMYTLFEPRACISLSLAEIARLRELAASHYDGTCKGAGEQGGFLYGWWIHATTEPVEDPVEVIATIGQMDTVCKILELADASDPLVVALNVVLRHTILAHRTDAADATVLNERIARDAESPDLR